MKNRKMDFIERVNVTLLKDTQNNHFCWEKSTHRIDRDNLKTNMEVKHKTFILQDVFKKN